MDDHQIIDLYWNRSEAAIEETSKKYARYCHSISFNILHNDEDAQECVNDTYLRAWNAMPPHRPNRLSTFLGKITRNLSLNRYKQYTAGKRGLGQTELVLSELNDCIPAVSDVEQATDEKLLIDELNRFLAAQPQRKRMVFVQRYWYLMSVRAIAEQHGMSETQTKSMLFRMRNELKQLLEKERIVL